MYLQNLMRQIRRKNVVQKEVEKKCVQQFAHNYLAYSQNTTLKMSVGLNTIRKPHVFSVFYYNEWYFIFILIAGIHK